MFPSLPRRAATLLVLTWTLLSPAGSQAQATDPWLPMTVLTQPDGAALDHFGVAVVFDGNTLVVGSIDDDQGNMAGAVYVFERHRGGHDAWGQTAKLVAFDGLPFDLFGTALALDGDTLVVGAFGDDGVGGNNDGSAYVFERDRGGADRWGLVRKIVPDDQWALDHFATSVALDGDTLVVGSPFDDDRGSGSGSVYVFERHAGGPDLWGQVAKLHASDTFAGDNLGFTVALDHDTLIAGARRDDGVGADAGALVVFERDAGGWLEVQKLVAPSPSAGGLLGSSLALDGDRLVTGSPKAGGPGAGDGPGSATVFERDASGSWSAVATFEPTAGAAGDDFGFAVALEGDFFVVGAPNTTTGGSLFGYGRTPAGSWQAVDGLSVDPVPGALGYAVAVERGLLAAGAIEADPKGQDSGELHLFRRPGSTCDPGSCSDLTRPIARIAPIPTTFCDCSGGTYVTLDGTLSYDRDGDPLGYSWFNPAGSVADPAAAVTTGFFPVGRTEILLEVDDGDQVSFPEAATVVVDYRADQLEISTPFVHTQFGSVEWGDYDGDGDLDLLLAGLSVGNSGTARIYRNEEGPEGPVFVDTELQRVAANGGRATWGDYDGDGDLDFVVTAVEPGDGGPIETRLYRNDGQGPGNDLWTEVEAGFLGVRNATAAWADFDNDGDLDLTLIGLLSSGARILHLYRNELDEQGVRRFVETGGVTPEVGLRNGAIDWGDFDDDGDLDLLISGNGQTSPDVFSGRIYRNDGPAGLVEIESVLPRVITSSNVWGDYDADGDLDILITGTTGTTRHADVLRNDGGVFVDVEAAMLGVAWGSAEWGDFDNDGDLDALVTGDVWWPDVRSLVYRNDGDDHFTDVELGLFGVRYSDGIWGDVDADGDLDVLVSGRNPAGAATKLYLNQLRTPNQPPTAPGDLLATVDGDRVDLAWSPATDVETPQPALTYNLWVQRLGASHAVMPAMADRISGRRHVVRRGNADHGTSWSLRGLDPGEYRWSVQAIDGAWEGSVFAPEGQFTIAGAIPGDLPGYWSLDEGVGGTTTTPTGLVGQLEGGVTWVPGQRGPALDFDGDSGLVSIPDDPFLDLESALTLAVWVRPDGPSTRAQSLISKDDAYELEIGKTAPDRWNLRLDNTVAVVASTAVDFGVWQHLAVTWDGSTVRAYRDGVADGEATWVGLLPDTPASLGLGGRPSAPSAGGPTFFFDGGLDDVRIYGRALTPEEIAALLANTAGDREPPLRTAVQPILVLPGGSTHADRIVTTSEDATCRASTDPAQPYDAMPWSATTDDDRTHQWRIEPLTDGDIVSWFVRCRDTVGNTHDDDLRMVVAVGSSDLVSDLVAYWDFDDGAGCEASDGTGSHPAMLGPSCPLESPSWVDGWVARGLDFDGDLDEIRVDSAPGLGQFSELTVSAWIRHPPTTAFRAILDHRDGGTDGVDLFLDSTSRLFFRVDSATLTSERGVADGAWHHVVATWGDGVLRIYIDGSLDAAGSASTAPVDVDAPMLLGRHFTTTDFPLDGTLDEVRIYHRALDAVEVMALLAASTP